MSLIIPRIELIDFITTLDETETEHASKYDYNTLVAKTIHASLTLIIELKSKIKQLEADTKDNELALGVLNKFLKEDCDKTGGRYLLGA